MRPLVFNLGSVNCETGVVSLGRVLHAFQWGGRGNSMLAVVVVLLAAQSGQLFEHLGL